MSSDTEPQARPAQDPPRSWAKRHEAEIIVVLFLVGLGLLVGLL